MFSPLTWCSLILSPGMAWSLAFFDSIFLFAWRLTAEEMRGLKGMFWFCVCAAILARRNPGWSENFNFFTSVFLTSNNSQLCASCKIFLASAVGHAHNARSWPAGARRPGLLGVRMWLRMWLLLFCASVEHKDVDKQSFLASHTIEH